MNYLGKLLPLLLFQMCLFQVRFLGCDVKHHKLYNLYVRSENSIEPHIRFTVELESDSRLAFLDTEIQLHEDGRLSTTTVTI